MAYGHPHARRRRSVPSEAAGAIGRFCGRHMVWIFAFFGLVGMLLVLGQVSAGARQSGEIRHYVSVSAATIGAMSAVGDRGSATAQVNLGGCASTAAGHSTCHAGAALFPQTAEFSVGLTGSYLRTSPRRPHASPVMGDLPVPRPHA